MKTLVLSMISIAATVAAMTACTSESDPINDITNPKDAKTPIEFASSIIGVQTKAMNSEATKFDANDEIAITMYKGNAEPQNAELGTPAKSNVKFIVGDDQTKLSEKAAEKTMFWDRNNKHYFYAYYPIAASDANYTYTAASGSSAEKITVTVPADGKTTDLLMGKISSGLSFSGTAVENANIQFSHKLSKINFVFIKDKSYQGAANLTAISLNIANSSVSIDLVSQTATLGGSPMDITKSSLNKVIDENATGTIFTDWSPIVTPGTTINTLKLTIDGKEIESQNLTATLKGGSITKITITLKGSGITELTTGITDWANDVEGSGDII